VAAARCANIALARHSLLWFGPIAFAALERLPSTNVATFGRTPIAFAEAQLVVDAQTAIEWKNPHATEIVLYAASLTTLTSAGSSLSAVDPRPSCPCLPCPHEYTAPSSHSATEWKPPSASRRTAWIGQQSTAVTDRPLQHGGSEYTDGAERAAAHLALERAHASDAVRRAWRPVADVSAPRPHLRRHRFITRCVLMCVHARPGWGAVQSGHARLTLSSSRTAQWKFPTATWRSHTVRSNEHACACK
jgi:hypothetical protein